MEHETTGPNALLIAYLRDWGAAANTIARDAWRTAEILESRDKEAMRKAKYRAGKRAARLPQMQSAAAHDDDAAA